MKTKLKCILFGHRWVERKPRKLFDLNDYDCSKCGAYKKQGLHE